MSLFEKNLTKEVEKKNFPKLNIFNLIKKGTNCMYIKREVTVEKLRKENQS